MLELENSLEATSLAKWMVSFQSNLTEESFKKSYRVPIGKYFNTMQHFGDSVPP